MEKTYKTIKKWEVLEETDISPSSWFPLYKHKIKLPNGKVVDDYYISKVGDVSMVVALTKSKKIIFVRQYKHGTGDVIIELPAGRIRKGNSPEKEAVMELAEETGYEGSEVELLGMIHGEPSKDTFNVYGYLIKNVELKNSQNLEETEDIEVLLFPASEIDKKVKEGVICSSDTLSFIYLAKLKYPELFS